MPEAELRARRAMSADALVFELRRHKFELDESARSQSMGGSKTTVESVGRTIQSVSATHGRATGFSLASTAAAKAGSRCASIGLCRAKVRADRGGTGHAAVGGGGIGRRERAGSSAG